MGFRERSSKLDETCSYASSIRVHFATLAPNLTGVSQPLLMDDLARKRAAFARWMKKEGERERASGWIEWKV